MSVAPLAAPTPPRSHGSLRLVAERAGTVRRAVRVPFPVIVLLVLLAGLLALLALNTVLAQDSFRLHRLDQQNAGLAERERLLQREVELLQSPCALQQQAEALGMVPRGALGFLQLGSGTVLGQAAPATAPPPGSAPPLPCIAGAGAGAGAGAAGTSAAGAP